MSAPDILCIGAAHWDIIGTTDAALPRGADRPGTVARSPGGVALNIARALAARGFHPALLTALGDDAEGDALAAAAGVDLGHALRLPGRATGAYVAIEAAGRLVAALADTAALHAAGAAILAPLRAGGALSGWRGTVVIDGNLAPEVVAAMADDPALAGCALRLVPASPVRAERLAPLAGHPAAMLHANRAEAAALTGRPCPDAPAAARALRAAGWARALVTDGARAAACACGVALHTARPPRVAARRITGAGDALIAAHIAAEHAGATPPEALRAALAAAADHVAALTTPETRP